jgi:hypothetical protein
MVLHPRKKLDEFNEILEELFYLSSEYGIEKCRLSKDDTLQQIKFYQFVHEGWKKAQNLTVKVLLDIQDEISEIKRKIKNHNRKGNRKHAKELKDVIVLLEGRRRKIQFSINAIVWTIFNLQHHVVRRFFLSDDIYNIDKYSLFKTLEFVNQENENPNKCAICCDLTTFMHVGDVLIIDLSQKKNPITLVELKEGKINEKCEDVLSQYYQTGCLRNLYFNTRDFEKGEIKQLTRMGRQYWRQAQAFSAITKGEGVDISTKQKLKIPDEEFIIESYEPLIIEMHDELSDKKTWSIRDVDKCLFLGLYKDQRLAEGAFQIWMKEIGVDSPVWNYQNVFSVPVARPPFTLLFPPDLIKGLVTGEIIMKMCLHVPFWIKMLNSTYQNAKVDLETLKKSRKTDSKSVHLFKYKNKLVKIETNTISGYIGSGILSKIIFDFYRPIDSLRPMISTHNVANAADS